MTEHEHKFNGTILQGHGRCSCGTWAKWSRSERAYTKVYDGPYAKGLETRLARLRDPDHSYPKHRGGPEAPLPEHRAGDVDPAPPKQPHPGHNLYSLIGKGNDD